MITYQWRYGLYELCIPGQRIRFYRTRDAAAMVAARFMRRFLGPSKGAF